MVNLRSLLHEQAAQKFSRVAARIGRKQIDPAPANSVMDSRNNCVAAAVDYRLAAVMAHHSA